MMCPYYSSLHVYRMFVLIWRLGLLCSYNIHRDIDIVVKITRNKWPSEFNNCSSIFLFSTLKYPILTVINRWQESPNCMTILTIHADNGLISIHLKYSRTPQIKFWRGWHYLRRNTTAHWHLGLDEGALWASIRVAYRGVPLPW